MNITIDALLHLLLWSNLFILCMTLLTLSGIKRERMKMQRVIISLVENRKRR